MHLQTPYIQEFNAYASVVFKFVYGGDEKTVCSNRFVGNLFVQTQNHLYIFCERKGPSRQEEINIKECHPLDNDVYNHFWTILCR